MANRRLNIVITALDKTKSAFRGISAGVGSVASAVFNLKTALVGVVGAAGIGLLIRNSLQATDALSKTAQKLGVTTESLSALRYAAELSGVGIQTTDMAIQRFTRRLSEAAQGTGEAKGALRELNIDAEALSRLPLEEQMFALADAFGNVKNANDQVRLGFKLFDSEGLAFINTLKEGRDGLQAMFQEAETLGVIMSSSAAKGVEDANDALTKLGLLLKGIVDQVVAALGPAIEEFANSLRDTVVVSINDANDSVKKFAERLATGLLESLAGTLRAFADFIEGVQDFVNILIDAANAIQRFRGESEFARSNLGLLVQGARDAATTIDNLASSIGNPGDPKSLSSALENSAPKLTALQELLQKVGKALQGATKETTTLQQTLDATAKKAIDGVTDALYNLATGAGSAKDAFKSMAKSILADMLKMAIRQQIVAPLFNNVGTFFSSFGGGGTSGTKAIGGSVQAGGSYMVGERGPEMFVPSRGGSIIPNDNLQSGGGVVNISLNIATGVSQTVRAEIA